MKKLKFFIGVFSILSIISTRNKLYAYNEIKGIFKSGNRENKNIPDNSQSRSENVQTPQVEIVTDPMWEYYTEYHESIDTELQDVYVNPSHETAVKHMVWVEVPIWKLKNGQKVTSKAKVQVLNLLAEDVKSIFTEIYNGPEKFPIKSLGGYNWRSNGLTSLHSTGRAIDINPDENPQVSADGEVLVGKKWEPGVNPYSITPDGDVVKAFSKKGWTWGAGFSRADYMHFDF